MASFRDQPPETGFGWIHDLARAEMHPDAEDLLNLGRTYDPRQLVEESTLDFLTQLRKHFTEYVRLFNAYAESGERFQPVKIYNVAQTPADFMLFRNWRKLLVTHSGHGMIQLTYTRHFRDNLIVDGFKPKPESPLEPAQDRSDEIVAQMDPFREVYWTFRGERIQAEKVARFYFIEFVRATRTVDQKVPASVFSRQ